MTRSMFLAAIFSVTIAAPAFAATCSVDIEGNDSMQYNKSSIDISKSCKDFTVNLKHVGKFPKNAMGHNWVLSKTPDMQGIATDGMTAGLEKDYLKPGDVRIVAATKLAGPGETVSVTFPVSKLTQSESYSFFCSFPGHSTIMKGTIQLSS